MYQLLLFNPCVTVSVREGTGCINYEATDTEGRTVFTDLVDVVVRVPREHSGWQSAFYLFE